MDASRIQRGGDLQSFPSIQPKGIEKGNFADFLKESLEKTNRLQQEAEKSAREFVAGQAKSIHETMIQMEKADISLRLITQIRNKVVEVYQEIMRMQI